MSADKDTGVNVRAYGGFAVLDSTDIVVVSGQRDSPSLYQFPITNHADQNQTEVPCRHVQFPLCLDISDKQYLVLSCDRCKNIKLVDSAIEEGKKVEQKALLDKPVYEGERVKKMCQGDKNILYATVHGTDRVLELKWFGGKFIEIKRISTGIKYPDGLCYVPPPHRLIVVSDHDGGKVQAVWPSVSSVMAQRLTGEQPVSSRGRSDSYERGVIVWKLSGAVDSKRIYPRGLLYLHSRQAVLVADGERRRVLVLESQTGSVLQTVRPDIPGPILSVMFDLCKYKEELLVSYRDYPGYLDADSDDELPVHVLQVKSEELSEVHSRLHPFDFRKSHK